MEPRIRDGESSWSNPTRPWPAATSVLVKSRDGRVMVKILGYTRDGYTHFLSINQNHKTVKIRAEEIEQLFVSAIVKASSWRPD